jgi:inhibitor of cysteine peptidase
MISISSDGADRAVNVPAGEEISVTLPENPTTGYRWVVEAVTGDLALVSADFSPPKEVKPGAGGHRTIHLRAGARGHGELRLRYERAWEGASDGARRCLLTFTVE